MSKLEPTKDSRTTYDKKTGAVRSFFGAELVAPISETKRALSPAGKSDDFLEVNRNLFKLKDVSLQKSDVREGADTRSVRYLQMHKGIPVYGAQLVVGQRKQDGAIISAVNEVDYNVPAKLDPDKIAIKADEAMAAVRKKFSARFENLEIGSPALYVYRHVTDDVFEPTFPLPAIRREMLEMSAGVRGQIYIVWRMLMDTRNPSGSWELFIDAMNGAVVAVRK